MCTFFSVVFLLFYVYFAEKVVSGGLGGAFVLVLFFISLG